MWNPFYLLIVHRRSAPMLRIGVKLRDQPAAGPIQAISAAQTLNAAHRYSYKSIILQDRYTHLLPSCFARINLAPIKITPPHKTAHPQNIEAGR